MDDENLGLDVALWRNSKLSEPPQWYIAYNWGSFESHRTGLTLRAAATHAEVYPRIVNLVRGMRPLGEPFFGFRSRFPGGLFTRLPSE